MPIALWVVYAREERPPPKADALVWFVLITLPVASTADAQRILQWYALRWRIEDYFRIIKSGCKVEELQHHTAEPLGDAVALIARLGGWLARTRDPPGAQLMWHGYTQLVAMAFAFQLRDEYG